MKSSFALLATLLPVPVVTRSAAAEPATPQTQPDILFLLAGHLGWTDTAAYGMTFDRRRSELEGSPPAPPRFTSWPP